MLKGAAFNWSSCLPVKVFSNDAWVNAGIFELKTVQKNLRQKHLNFIVTCHPSTVIVCFLVTMCTVRSKVAPYSLAPSAVVNISSVELLWEGLFIIFFFLLWTKIAFTGMVERNWEWVSLLFLLISQFYHKRWCWVWFKEVKWSRSFASKHPVQCFQSKLGAFSGRHKMYIVNTNMP